MSEAPSRVRVYGLPISGLQTTPYTAEGRGSSLVIDLSVRVCCYKQSCWILAEAAWIGSAIPTPRYVAGPDLNDLKQYMRPISADSLQFASYRENNLPANPGKPSAWGLLSWLVKIGKSWGVDSSFSKKALQKSSFPQSLWILVYYSDWNKWEKLIGWGDDIWAEKHPGTAKAKCHRPKSLWTCCVGKK